MQYNVPEVGVVLGQTQEMEVDPETEAAVPSKSTKPMTVSELRRGLDFYSSDLPQKGTVSTQPHQITTTIDHRQVHFCTFVVGTFFKPTHVKKATSMVKYMYSTS